MKEGWEVNPKFAAYRTTYNSLSVQMKNKKDMQRIFIFCGDGIQIMQNNKRYLVGNVLLRYVFGELKIGIMFAKLIEGIVPCANDLSTFEPPIHKKHIDIKELYIFLQNEVCPNQITILKSSLPHDFHQNYLPSIISGLDFWNNNASDEVVVLRKIVFTKYGAHPST